MWLICQVVGHKVGPWILTPTDVGRLDHGCVRMVSPSRTVVWALCCICSRSWEVFLLMVASAYTVSISLVFCHNFLFERVWWSMQFCQVPTVENGTEAPEEMLLLQCKGQLSCKNKLILKSTNCFAAWFSCFSARTAAHWWRGQDWLWGWQCSCHYKQRKLGPKNWRGKQGWENCK